jgi:hypothetical protein
MPVPTLDECGTTLEVRGYELDEPEGWLKSHGGPLETRGDWLEIAV